MTYEIWTVNHQFEMDRLVERGIEDFDQVFEIATTKAADSGLPVIVLRDGVHVATVDPYEGFEQGEMGVL